MHQIMFSFITYCIFILSSSCLWCRFADDFCSSAEPSSFLFFSLLELDVDAVDAGAFIWVDGDVDVEAHSFFSEEDASEDPDALSPVWTLLSAVCTASSDVESLSTDLSLSNESSLFSWASSSFSFMEGSERQNSISLQWELYDWIRKFKKSITENKR